MLQILQSYKCAKQNSNKKIIEIPKRKLKLENFVQVLVKFSRFLENLLEIVAAHKIFIHFEVFLIISNKIGSKL